MSDKDLLKKINGIVTTWEDGETTALAAMQAIAHELDAAGWEQEDR